MSQMKDIICGVIQIETTNSNEASMSAAWHYAITSSTNILELNEAS